MTSQKTKTAAIKERLTTTSLYLWSYITNYEHYQIRSYHHKPLHYKFNSKGKPEEQQIILKIQNDSYYYYYLFIIFNLRG